MFSVLIPSASVTDREYDALVLPSLLASADGSGLAAEHVTSGNINSYLRVEDVSDVF